MSTSNGIISKIRENIVLFVVGVLLTISLGVIFTSVAVNIDIYEADGERLGSFFQTSNLNEALVIVTVTNEATFEFKAVKIYFLLDIEIDDASIDSTAYYEDVKYKKIRSFSDESLNLGYIAVTKDVPCKIYIRKVNEESGQVIFTVQVYAKIFGFPILVKKQKADFIWVTLPPLTVEAVEEIYTLWDYYAFQPDFIDPRRIVHIPP